MPCFVGLLAVIFPRFMIVVLYFFTNWFDGVFDSLLWLLLGFIFAPLMLLWFACIQIYFGGEWNALTIGGMVIAGIIDFGGIENTRRRRSSLW